MKVIAKMKNLRIAPRKTKLVADLVRGLDTEEALIQLDHCPKKTATYIKKLILSAMANGENNFGIDKKNMYISEIFVGAGPVLKRWMPKAFGRAGRILKRTSQITVVISEKIEGEGRKSPEQLEKERKARLEEKKKLEKEARKNQEQTEKEENKEKKKKPSLKSDNVAKKEVEKDKNKSEKKGWASKIFRRKSM